ncbi:[2Fe-2S]-binding domain protein [Treponema phagedenis F0421]|nr:[2Fe-2S]-binding domain protein [Treponema phagedenis F0421]
MQVTIAYAENAAQNGVEFFLNTAATGMIKNGNAISQIITNRGTCNASLVINAAGFWADVVAGFAGDRFFSIHGRKGTDAILDKRLNGAQKTSAAMPDLLKLRKGHSKGGGIMPCIEGNVLIGPNAFEVMDREDFSTSAESLTEIKKHLSLNSKVSPADIITYYSGVRACTWEEDFIVEASERVENLVHAAGIQSQGFASAPAIAEDVTQIAVDILKKKIKVELNKNFNPNRKHIQAVAELSSTERQKLIEKDPLYGKIICRCEQISEGEIWDAVNNPLGVLTLNGIKRRVRAGAGRCHGGFCTPHVLKIIAEEKNAPIESITKKGGCSQIVQPITESDVFSGGAK